MRAGLAAGDELPQDKHVGQLALAPGDDFAVFNANL
jgi:hypothetical protein